MMRMRALIGLVAGLGAVASAQQLPTGQSLSPLAAPGAVFRPLVSRVGPHPDYIADGAAAIAVSPNRREMLVLTSGFNRFNGSDGKVVAAQSGQYVFAYRIDCAGARLEQTLVVPNAYSGIAWTPDGRGFAVGGGVARVVHRLRRGQTGFGPARTPLKRGPKLAYASFSRC